MGHAWEAGGWVGNTRMAIVARMIAGLQSDKGVGGGEGVAGQ